MSDKPKEMKIVFAQGATDGLTQEDIDEITSALKTMIEEGTLEENSSPLSPLDVDEFLDSLSEEERSSFESQIHNALNPPRLHRR